MPASQSHSSCLSHVEIFVSGLHPGEQHREQNARYLLGDPELADPRDESFDVLLQECSVFLFRNDALLFQVLDAFV